MKGTNNLTYANAVLLGLLSEAALIAIQYVYLNILSDAHAATGFTSAYMKTTGFYIFQIIGFFLYTAVIYSVVRKSSTKIFGKVSTVLIVGGIIELSFYIFIVADYEGVFFYSILDKVIASVFGMILSNYTTNQSKRPGSYF